MGTSTDFYPLRYSGRVGEVVMTNYASIVAVVAPAAGLPPGDVAHTPGDQDGDPPLGGVSQPSGSVPVAAAGRAHGALSHSCASV